MAGVTTSVRIDIDNYLAAQKAGLNISDLANRAIRSVVKTAPKYQKAVERLETIEERMGDEAVSAIEEDRIISRRAVEEALSELQPLWNIYVGSDPPKSVEARLNWAKGHQERYGELKGMTPEELMKELGG
jgi:post-segregation antitoxin (ccd killing protein)